MQNDVPNIIQEPIQANNTLNDDVPTTDNNLRQLDTTASTWQNPIRTLREQFQTLSPETRNTLKEFRNVMGSMTLGIGNVYSIINLAKKDKSGQEKNLSPLIATMLVATNLLVAAATALRLKRNRANNQADASDGNTIALSTDLRQEQEAMQDEELGNQQENAE